MRTWSIALVAILFALGTSSAAEGDLSANAALHYWQAFAGLPRLDDTQARKLGDGLTMPLDDDARAWVNATSDSLRELHYGAALPNCAWGISFEDGFFAVMHHTRAARRLANLMTLRIRIAFDEVRVPEAVGDALAMLTMARHLSTDGTLLSWLVGGAIEQQTYILLAAFLPKLGQGELARLGERLGKLPKGGTLAACVATEEKAGLDWFIGRVKATKNEEELFQMLAGFQGENGEPMARKVLRQAGGKAEGVVKLAEELRPLYTEFVKKQELTPNDFEKAWNEATGKLKDNGIFALLCPALAKMRHVQARNEVHTALWNAALAVQREGKEALARFQDPYTEGGFRRENFPGGYVLKARTATLEGKLMSLTVGQREKE